MQFIELAKQRFSCRSFKPQPVEKEKLELVMEAARIAPSAANYQPWHFIVVSEKEQLLQVQNAYRRSWLLTAPVVIVACVDSSKAWIRSFDSKNHSDIDIAIAIDHITLQASDLGLATCWICHFEIEKCRTIFNLPDYVEPIALIPIGYPDAEPKPDRHNTQRKSSSEIVHWEKW